MLTIKDSFPDLVIPDCFKVAESAREWRIIRADCEAAVDYLFSARYNTADSGTVRGRGSYPVARIKTSAGKEIEVIIRAYRRGGLAGLVLPDMFTDARRPLEELALTEKGRVDGVALPEIIGLQMKWVAPFFYRARIAVKKIPDTITLNETLLSFAKEGGNHKELYAKKRSLIAALVKSVRQLHNAGINHRDLNIRNILIKRAGLDFTAYIIDLDKSACEPGPKGLGFDKRIDNLIRLNRSLSKMLFKSGLLFKEVLSQTDRRRFLESYLQGEGITRERKRAIINACLRRIGLHKWWWQLIYPAHK
jgi:3-deoxy-D-manno-octulosonic acid kinase